MSNASNRQILVVDDNPEVLETIAMLLISAGHVVRVAEDGFAALLQLREMQPDIMISDLEMPRMSGFELLSVVRRRFPQIITLAMSGAYAGDGLPAGVIADGFYAKGGHLRNLFGAIERSIAASGGNPHRQEVAPAWVPRNGNDSHGIPYVMVACEECLRVFSWRSRKKRPDRCLKCRAASVRTRTDTSLNLRLTRCREAWLRFSAIRRPLNFLKA